MVGGICGGELGDFGGWLVGVHPRRLVVLFNYHPTRLNPGYFVNGARTEITNLVG